MPLYKATEKGYNEIVKRLLRYGAKPNTYDNKGRTPFSVLRQDATREWLQRALDMRNADVNTLEELAVAYPLLALGQAQYDIVNTLIQEDTFSSRDQGKILLHTIVLSILRDDKN